jgi:TetR/AcrR family transcriptional regulator
MHGSDRRQQLIDAALDVFSRRGFAGATTKEISETAGVTEALVFRYFATKKDLYTAVLERETGNGRLQKWLELCDDCMSRNDDAGLFRLIIEGIFESYRDRPGLERTILFAALEGHELGLEYHRRLALPIGGRLIEYIARRQREGALRSVDPRALLISIAGAAQQAAMLTHLFGFEPKLSDADMANELLTVILQGAKA